MRQIIPHILNCFLDRIGHEIVGIIGPQLIKDPTNQVKRHNDSNIGGIKSSSRHSFSHFQEILSQFGNGKPQNKGFHDTHDDADDF